MFESGEFFLVGVIVLMSLLANRLPGMGDTLGRAVARLTGRGTPRD